MVLEKKMVKEDIYLTPEDTLSELYQKIGDLLAEHGDMEIEYDYNDHAYIEVDIREETDQECLTRMYNYEVREEREALRSLKHSYESATKQHLKPSVPLPKRDIEIVYDFPLGVPITDEALAKAMTSHPGSKFEYVDNKAKLVFQTYRVTEASEASYHRRMAAWVEEVKRVSEEFGEELVTLGKEIVEQEAKLKTIKQKYIDAGMEG